MAEKIECTSCKANITNSSGTAKFKCPNCGEFEFVRCKHCREIAAKYKCANCGFTGPA